MSDETITKIVSALDQTKKVRDLEKKLAYALAGLKDAKEQLDAGSGSKALYRINKALKKLGEEYDLYP